MTTTGDFGNLDDRTSREVNETDGYLGETLERFAGAIQTIRARHADPDIDQHEALWATLGELARELRAWADDDGWWERAANKIADGPIIDDAFVLLNEDLDSFLDQEYEVFVADAGLGSTVATVLVGQLREALKAPAMDQIDDPGQAMEQARDMIQVAALETEQLLENQPATPSGWSKIVVAVGKGVRGIGGGTTITVNATTARLPIVAVVASGLSGLALVFDAFRRSKP